VIDRRFARVLSQLRVWSEINWLMSSLRTVFTVSVFVSWLTNTALFTWYDLFFWQTVNKRHRVIQVTFRLRVNLSKIERNFSGVSCTIRVDNMEISWQTRTYLDTFLSRSCTYLRMSTLRTNLALVVDWVEIMIRRTAFTLWLSWFKSCGSWPTP